MKNLHESKRILSLFLAIIMILGVFPNPISYAADEMTTIAMNLVLVKYF